MNLKQNKTTTPTILNSETSKIHWNEETWKELEESYTKTELVDGWLPFVKQFFADNPDRCWEDVSSNDILLRTNPIQDTSKRTLCHYIFSVLRNKDIFTDFLNFLPSISERALTIAAWRARPERQEMEVELGVSVLNEDHELLRELKILKVQEAHGNWNLRYSHNRKGSSWNATFYLPSLLRNILKEYLNKPEGYYIATSPKVSFPKDVQLFSAEQRIFEELPKLLAYHQQGKLKYNLHGKPDLANIKKIAKALDIQEFYPEYPVTPTRTNMLSGILYEYAENRTHLEEVIKVLFQEHFAWKLKHTDYVHTRAPLFIYNYLKGLARIEETSFDGEFNIYLTQLLQKLPVGEWVMRDNYIRHLAFHAVQVHPIRLGEERRLYYDQQDGDLGYKFREKIDSGNVQHFVILPYALGLLFVLAALGMVEVAYSKVNTDNKFGTSWFSEYDGLEAFRLTALGAYALGMADSYEAPVTLATNKFIFEEDALMLRVEGDFDIIDVMLEQFLEKTSTNRYAFNTGLFLSDCKTLHDIEVKIKLFKQTINTSLPQFWQNYLNQLLENTKSIQQKQDVIIYQIDATNKDLQRLMAQDVTIKSLILKAEQFHVLIPTKNMSRFQSRMKELGFLVERER